MEQGTKERMDARKEAYDKEIGNMFGMLEKSVEDMNKSARVRGFAEGCVVTLGVVILGFVTLGIFGSKK